MSSTMEEKKDKSINEEEDDPTGAKKEVLGHDCLGQDGLRCNHLDQDGLGCDDHEWDCLNQVILDTMTLSGTAWEC